MWIVRFALQRPYTFVIVAVLIAIFGGAAIATTPTDILPDINIPIVSVIWTYSGLDADDMSKRIVGVCERAIPTTVNNVQYTESQSYSGVGVIKVHFQPSVQVDLAIAQVTALAQSVVHLMPPGTLSPYVLKYDASSVPIVQVSLGGKGLSQTELYDLGQNFIRGQLATINGTSVPLPYGGQQRSIMVDVEPGQLAANHLTSEDISAALNNQNLVTPSGTQKIGDREYLVGTNSSAGTIAELNNLPIRTKNGAVVQMKDVAWVHNGYQPQTSHRGPGKSGYPKDQGGAAGCVDTDPDLRPVGDRARIDPGRGAGGDHGGDADGTDDPDLSRQLAEHADCLCLDPVGGIVRHCGVLSAGGNDQRDVAGRPGAGGGHARGRCHGGDRKHSPQSCVGRQKASGDRHIGQCGASGRARLDLNDVYLHCLCTGDVAFGLREVHLHAAGAERGAGDDCILRAVTDAGPDDDALPAAGGGAALSRAGQRDAAKPELDLAAPSAVRARL
jgi:hypothetical protein